MKKAGHLLDLRRLPIAVARFLLRARSHARRSGDAWALEAATRPRDLAAILRLARGRTEVVELGTGPGWTALALALADAARRVTSYDPVDHATPYAGLVGAAVRERVKLRHGQGSEGPQPGDPPVDLLFIDSTHEREQTVAELAAWRPALAPGALVLFHDYGHPGFPGVAEAVSELGLHGSADGGIFVWRA